LSAKAAATICKRFLELFSITEPLPEEIVSMLDERLRGLGLSNAKVQ
jgi:3-methyladenine DNA glycosylase/8-oxoguanine DNA glycosylase